MTERENNARELKAFFKAKKILLEAIVDLDIFKNMSSIEFAILNIPFGLEKYLAQDIKYLLKK